MVLLWAGVFLIGLGAACLPFDRRAAHALYDYGSKRFVDFLEGTTHFAKAAHWLAVAAAVLALAQIALHYGFDWPVLRDTSRYAEAFIACLAAGSAILHGIKLVVGRRRPRDDMEMGLFGFAWFKFKLDYNSFPSGHSLTIMCVAVVASCAWPHFAVLWFAIALWLGLTRALLTAHFLSDVFIGGGIGLIAARETLVYFFKGLAPNWF